MTGIGKVVCVGLDYADHAAETGAALGRPDGYLRPGDTMRLEIDGLGDQHQALGAA